MRQRLDRRMSSKLRRPFDLAAVRVLEAQYVGFREDFETFFPEVIAHVSVREDITESECVEISTHRT